MQKNVWMTSDVAEGLEKVLQLDLKLEGRSHEDYNLAIRHLLEEQGYLEVPDDEPEDEESDDADDDEDDGEFPEDENELPVYGEHLLGGGPDELRVYGGLDKPEQPDTHNTVIISPN